MQCGQHLNPSAWVLIKILGVNKSMEQLLFTNSEGTELFHEDKKGFNSRDFQVCFLTFIMQVVSKVKTYGKYCLDRYHSLHIYGKVISFIMSS